MTGPTASGTDLTVSSFSAYAGQTNVLLQATGNVIFSGGLMSLPALPAGATSGQLVVEAGNNITVDNGSAIIAGTDWSITMVAGTGFSGTNPPPGNDGIYLSGNAYLQSQNGVISLSATNEILVGTGAIRTLSGGNIAVTTEYGNVNTGTSTSGFNYTASAPYYTPSPTLGGISTAAGGNVTIHAGGDVISFPTTTVAAGDPGSGAFGPEPGNVTINADGNVYGHFVVMNGTGTVQAGQNIGASSGNQNVALSLARGSWNLNAQNNIYLQEVRNPNGVFDNLTIFVNRQPVPSPGNHLFDYDPQASVTLTASNGVYLTGYYLPRPNDAVPLLMPPTLAINAGSTGITLEPPNAINGSGTPVTLLDDDITLFPSTNGNLQITTTNGGSLNGNNATLLMSDSAQTQWSVTANPQTFSSADHASTPPELNNTNPVAINLSGTMENVTLQTSKQTQINVAGDMIGCSFYGENLQATQTTSLDVGGQIYNASSFNSVGLNQAWPTLPLIDTPPVNELPAGATLTSWYLPLAVAVNPSSSVFSQSYLGYSPSQLAGILSTALAFPGLNFSSLAYDPGNQTLTAIGPMSSALLNALESPTLTVARYDSNGIPLLDANGHFVLDSISWVPINSTNHSEINALYTESQGSVPLGSETGAYVVGGTGQFNVTAGSLSLGDSIGILSLGNGRVAQVSYAFLAPYISSGATIDVTVAGDLIMPGSTIAALGGGDVNVTSTGGAMNLGSSDLAPFESQIMNTTGLGLGIYTSGGGNVNVTASGDINIDTSRIATFNGGNIFVESLTGNVNAGSGTSMTVPVNVFAPTYSGGEPVEYVAASGIAALTLANPSPIPGSATVPGNIIVLSPQGNISANQGGILQEVLNGSLPSGPTITLAAGTPGVGGWGSTNPPVYIGNVYLGNFGVIGGTITVEATGIIIGIQSNLIASISQTNGILTVSWNLEGGQLNAQEIPGFVVETSTNLVDWTISNPSISTNASGGLSFEAPIPADSSNGFYRIWWQ